MTPQDQKPEITPSVADPPATVSTSAPPPETSVPESPSAAPPAPNFYHGPRSKIASLPKNVRDHLNSMLRDGFQHADIVLKLGDAAKSITTHNVSVWSRSPAYQQWLLEQEWLQQLRPEQESSLDLLTDLDTARFNEGALQLAVTRLFSALRHMETTGLDDKLGGSARIFANIVHALARACRETTNIEKYRAACAKAVAAELKQLNEDRDLSDNEFALVTKRMDRVFKVARPPSPPAPPPPNAPITPTLHHPITPSIH